MQQGLRHLQRYSLELYQVLVRIYNSVSGSEVMRFTGNQLNFSVKKVDLSRLPVMLTLYQKLVVAFNKVQHKYITPFDDRLGGLIRLDLSETDTEITIQIFGLTLVPPTILKRLLSLFLWYEIRYQTGNKPKNSKYGSTKTMKLKSMLKDLVFDCSKLQSKLIKQKVEKYCNTCGESTYFINKWQYKVRSLIRNYETPVCHKHLNNRL